MSEHAVPRDLIPATKIAVPQLRPTLIGRERLIGRMVSALASARLVLLSAPAGFGKTTAVVQMLDSVSPGMACFWISADRDDTLERLLSTLITALEPADIPWRVSPQGLATMASDVEIGPARVADAIADALGASATERGVIVIDDCHRLVDDAISTWLDRLVERLPPNWTLVLTTRTDPRLPLARLKAQGMLAEFRAEDLRFERDEVERLAARAKTPLAVGQAGTIWEKMAGWPVGCELALRADVTGGGYNEIGAAGFDMLSSEVLDHLPEALRSFLLRSAVLPVLTAPLCAAVSGSDDSAALLREIQQRGLFATTLSSVPLVLRLHDLFRAFLLARLREELPGTEISALLIRAAEAEDNPDRRIGFLCEAGALETAEKELLFVARELMLRGDVERIVTLMGLFPSEHRQKSGELALLAGMCASTHSQWAEMRRHMIRAAELFEAEGNRAQFHHARAQEAIAFVGLAMPREAMARIEELESDVTDIATLALCAYARYWIARLAGTAEMECASFDRMLDLLLKGNDPLNWHQWHIYLGAQRGMRARAERYATAVLGLASPEHHPLMESGMSMRMWSRMLGGDYQGAIELIPEIESAQNWRGRPHSVKTFLLVARLLTAYFTGDAKAIRKLGEAHLAEFSGREGVSWAYWRGTTQVFIGKLAAALDDWDEVRSMSQKLALELQILDTPYLRIGKASLDLMLALDRREKPSPELLAVFDALPLKGDIVILEPGLIAARARLLACDHAYEAAAEEVGRLVREMEETGEELHLAALGPSALRELANLPATSELQLHNRDVVLSVIKSLERTRQALTDSAQKNAGGLTPAKWKFSN